MALCESLGTGGDIEYKRIPLWPLGCNEDGQVSGGYGEFQPTLDEKY
jgi:hypothetical protein